MDSNPVRDILVKLGHQVVCGHLPDKLNRYHGHAEGQIQDGLYGPIIIQYDLLTSTLHASAYKYDDRPAKTEPSPFSLIANDSQDLTAMQKAEASAKPVVVSDWTHLTSDEFLAAEKATGYDIL